MRKPKILLVDDDMFNRDGVSRYLHQHGYAVVEAQCAASALRLLDTEKPDAALVDIVIPAASTTSIDPQDSQGVQLAMQIKRKLPAIGVVIFSAFEDRGRELFEAVGQGMRGIGYQLKGCRPSTLHQALRDVMAGRVAIAKGVTGHRSGARQLTQRLHDAEREWVIIAAKRMSSLTQREYEVAERVAAAHSTKHIAASLNLTPKTVENYIRRTYSKLGLMLMRTSAPELRQAIILAKAFMLYELKQR